MISVNLLKELCFCLRRGWLTECLLGLDMRGTGLLNTKMTRFRLSEFTITNTICVLTARRRRIWVIKGPDDPHWGCYLEGEKDFWNNPILTFWGRDGKLYDGPLAMELRVNWYLHVEAGAHSLHPSEDSLQNEAHRPWALEERQVWGIVSQIVLFKAWFFVKSGKHTGRSLGPSLSQYKPDEFWGPGGDPWYY